MRINNVAPESPHKNIEGKIFADAKKYEDLSATPDGALIFATTTFSMPNPDITVEDRFNNLLVWPKEHPEKVQIVDASTRKGVTSSLAVQENLKKCLKGAGHFKVEGLAALPNNRLLFGIREVGKDFSSAQYTALICSADYRMDAKGAMKLSNWQFAYQFAPQISDHPDRKLGLSGLAYDPYHEQLLILTSYEAGEARNYGDLGGYLWTVSLKDFFARKAPQLVEEGNTHRPFEFANKPEGITVLNAAQLLVIHDDDRVIGTPDLRPLPARNLHQSTYAILNWN